MHKVSLARCNRYEREEVKRSVARSIELLGGIGKFVNPGSKVLIKPNFLRTASREARVATDPEVVRAIAELCIDAGVSEVMIGDSPAQGSQIPVARKAGYLDILNGLPIIFVDLDDPVEVKGRVYPKLEISKKVLDADAVINVAKAKTHALTGLTLAIKNCFGCIPGLRKAQWHLKSGRNVDMFCSMLVDICYSVKPVLNIIDAVIGMEGNGPGNGTPRSINAIIAGDDAVACDIVMAEILNFPLKDLPAISAAIRMGVGPDNLSKIEILGEPISQFKLSDFNKVGQKGNRAIPDFGLDWLRRSATPKPFVLKAKCTKCRQCVEMCPVQAISLNENDPAVVIDHAKCIRCFCCQEICPHQSIEVRTDYISRILMR